MDAPLPGAQAHLTLAPRPRHGWRPDLVPETARAAAGLVLLYPVDGRPHLILTVRAAALQLHAGQVSLPGGRVEADETVEQAALREASEEVGLRSEQVALLGRLSTLYIPASDFALHPVVGTTTSRPAFRAQVTEVGRLLEVDLSRLHADAPTRLGYRWRGPDVYEVPFVELAGERVWGATAMILAELMTIAGVPLTGADPSSAQARAS